MARNELQECLAELKLNLKAELASTEPAQSYIDDLKQSIKSVQGQIKHQNTSFLMVKEESDEVS